MSSFLGMLCLRFWRALGRKLQVWSWGESEAVQLGVISLAMVVELVGRGEFTKGKSMERECFPFFYSFT